MSRFLRRLFVFLLISIVPLCITEVYGTHYLRSLNHYAVEPYADFMQQGPSKRDVNTLVMGTSRAWVQYNPAILDSILGTTTYNMGCNGRGLETCILKWQTYLQYKNPIPNLILYDIGLYGFTDENTAGYKREQFYPYMLHDRSIRHFVLNHHFCNVIEKYVPGIRYIGIRNFRIGKWDPTYNNNGFNSRNLHFNDTEFEQFTYIKPRYDTSILTEFEHFLTQCNSMNIEVVLVHSPLYQPLYKMIDSAVMGGVFHDIANQHDLLLLDYNVNPMCLDTIYFSDASHLNTLGAVYFSRLLAHDLDSLGIVQH